MDATYTSRTSFIARNRVTSFIILTFSISYLLGIPFNMLLSPLVKDSNEVIAVLLPRLITVYGPAIAAVILTFFSAQPFSTKSMLSRLVPRSKHMWWCLAIPFVFILITFTSFAIAGVPMEQLLQFLMDDWYWLLFQLGVQFFIVGIGEELGWRGWLLPTLAQRRSLFICVLWIIVIWGLWHFPFFFRGYRLVLPWLMVLVAMAFLTTWLWRKLDGNIFVLAVMHASFNTPEAFLENQLNQIKGSEDLILSGWATVGYAYLLVAFIVVVGSRKVWTTAPAREAIL